MSPHGDSNYYIDYFSSSGDVYFYEEFAYSAVRPVINLKKCAISN